jgi:hypothetical protein
MPSAVIQTMRFDPMQKILEIVFRGARGAYRYFEVPLEEWQRFRNAPSKGTYLNQFFKSKKYRYEKLSGKNAAAPGKFQPCHPSSFCWPHSSETSN